jgi:hypothetical protein
MMLKGPGGSLVGFPLITFDQTTISRTSDVATASASVHFTNATSAAGLDLIKPSTQSSSSALSYATTVAADYDNDGDIDLYVSSCTGGSQQCRHYLLNNELGRFRDVTRAAGINHTGRDYSAKFADYDNDGYMDLYVLHEGGNLLYRNTGKGTFENVTAKSKAGDKTPEGWRFSLIMTTTETSIYLKHGTALTGSIVIMPTVHSLNRVRKQVSPVKM